MFRLEMYAIIARDRQREVLKQARLNALLRERDADSETIPDTRVFSQKFASRGRKPASGSPMAEARVVEGNR